MSELETSADAQLPRRQELLSRDNARGPGPPVVGIWGSKRRLEPVVDISDRLTVEDIEDIRDEHDAAPAADFQRIGGVPIQRGRKRRTRLKPIRGLESRAAWRERNLAPVLIDGVGGEAGQRLAGAQVETGRERQPEIQEVRSVHLHLVWSIERQRSGPRITLEPDVALVTEPRRADRDVAGVVGRKVVQRRDARIGLTVVVAVEAFER